MRQRWTVAVIALGTVVGLAAFHWSKLKGETGLHVGARHGGDESRPTAPPSEPADESTEMPRPRVVVVHPREGNVVRNTDQPGLIEAYDYAELFAKVSGYLEVQRVDIGDHVKEGQPLAKIEVPELVQAVRQAAAELEQARAQVQVADAAVAVAKAEVEAAKANVEQKHSDVKRANADLEFRNTQLKRMSDLLEMKSIDARAVDESRKERDAAAAAKDVTEAAVLTAQAEQAAKQAKIAQALADLANARAKVQVASSVLEKAKVYVGYTTITSPYNGVITQRGYHVGDFIRAADQGGQTPLLTVALTEKMRVVVQIPDVLVPYTDAGDPALVRIDSLSDREFRAKVSRIAYSEDRLQKAMRVEIDLDNPTNELRDGMFCHVTVELSRSVKGLTVPSTSVISDPSGKSLSVDIVRAGRLQKVPVKVFHDDGVRAEILSGVRKDDLVVAQPTEDLASGTPVEAVEARPGKPAKSVE